MFKTKLFWKDIYEGWRNHLMPPAKLRELIANTSEERLAVCGKCAYQSDNAKKNGYETIRIDLHCVACGCPLMSKTKCLSCYCPLSPPKWEAVLQEAEENYLKQRSDEQSLPN